MYRRTFDAIVEEKRIMAVKNEAQLREALQHQNRVIFLLYGDLVHLPHVVQTIQARRKFAVVHVDLIQGLSADPVAVDYLQQLGVDGVISTHPQVIHRARKIGVFSVFRFFLIDSLSRENMHWNMRQQQQPDLYDILPGLMTYHGLRGASAGKVPLIAGGLIETPAQYEEALRQGAVAVSTSSSALWR